jgi:hypothetical protein
MCLQLSHKDLTFLVQVSGFVFPEAHIGLVADGMKHVLAVHSFRNLEMAGREADEDFDMGEEQNIKEPLEDILQQVRFQIFFSLYLIGSEQ